MFCERSRFAYLFVDQLIDRMCQDERFQCLAQQNLIRTLCHSTNHTARLARSLTHSLTLHVYLDTPSTHFLLQVLPYCLFNVAISALIQWLDAQDGISLAISDKGHSFMNLMVAFLIVSRVNISIGRYNQARGYLSVMYREARELIQNTAVLSGHNTDVRAKQWRNDVAYQTCILLRVAMGVIDYEEEYVNVWELEELDQDEREDIQKFLFLETSSNQNALRWGHAVRTEYEENMRVPIRLAYLLRKLIKTQRTELGDPLVIGFELKLMGSVDSFMGGYYG